MIQLRDLQPEDEERLYRWRSEPEVERWMSDAAFASREEHDRWFDGMLNDPSNRGWMICRDNRPAGLLTLTGLTHPHKHAQWNWFVGEASLRGHGVGRATQALGLDRAFGELHLAKVWAEILAENDAALRSAAAVGFRREGYLRQHALKNGVFRDVVLVAMLRDEWARRREPVRRELAMTNMIAA